MGSNFKLGEGCWIHFIELSSANGTQLEHQQVAVACAQAIAAIFPMATDLVAKT